MTEQDRALATEALGNLIIEELPGLIVRATRGVTSRAPADDDIKAVGVSALVSVATAFAAHGCVDQAAVVALIHCLAESAAADIYEGGA